MHGHGKSDKPVVPEKPPNNGGRRRQQGYGGPYTGTKAETPDTAKGTPTARHGDGGPPAEEVEERGLTKRNSGRQPRSPTQRRKNLQHALDRVRRAARKDRGLRFTALWHHVYDVARLR